MNATSTISPADQLANLERLWVRFQLDVAAMRPALGPLFNAAARGRRAHTFVQGKQPPELAIRAVMGPTDGEANGVPDAFGKISAGSYSGRIVSVAAASTILVLLDTAIQSFARELSSAGGGEMSAGDEITFALGKNVAKASTLIWAGANNVRHIDEWVATAKSFHNPVTRDQHRLRSIQEKSMMPIASALGVGVPIIDNVAYELFHLLTMINEQRGSYDRLELHVLRIGQDLVQRGGLEPAPIGVTVTQTVPRNMIDASSNFITISDGIARSASSVKDVGNIFNVRPLDQERNGSAEERSDDAN